MEVGKYDGVRLVVVFYRKLGGMVLRGNETII
jgi:hypothetical protein